MKSPESTQQILSDLKVQLRKGRRQYWKAIHSGAYEEAENISVANSVLRAKIEVVELILSE